MLAVHFSLLPRLAWVAVLALAGGACSSNSDIGSATGGGSSATGIAGTPQASGGATGGTAALGTGGDVTATGGTGGTGVAGMLCSWRFRPWRCSWYGRGIEPDPNATRDVTYVVVPEGLKISVAGVRFAVSASAVQVASGWGVKLNVVASTLDGKAHSLSNPKSGPLAFAGSVLRKGRSEAEPFGDERAGDGEQEISAEAPTKFHRTWPAQGVRVLGAGDSLDLQVALWGLGSDKDSRRPVKKFCHVRMQVEKGKPRAIIEPPQGTSK